MQITKMHGLGNDFIIFCPKDETKDFSAIAKKMCARRISAGADGILLVLPSETCDIRMRIINADGSEAEMCGNGIRCFAKYVYEKGIVKKEEMTIETLAGTIKPKLVIDDGAVISIIVDMGKPIFDPDEIPTRISREDILSKEIDVLGEKFEIACINVGVPHAMVFVDYIDDEMLRKVGPIIEKDNLFPNNTNVNFVEVVNKSTIKVSTWERGAGKTMACGTGCCASVVACYLRDFTDRKVTVKLEVGDLYIEYLEDKTVLMTGPAEVVYEGIYFE